MLPSTILLDRVYRTAAGSVVRVIARDSDARALVWAVELVNPDRDVFIAAADLVAEVVS
jgi:hypothetical protein